MLDTVSELAENAIRYVGRTLGHEIDSDSLAPDQAYNLLDLVGQSLRCVVKQHVRLVEEEHKLREIHVADLREGDVKLGKQPKQES